MTISYCTTNINKFNEAKFIFGDAIEHKNIDLTEIQSMDLSFVALNKAADAYDKIKSPLIVEDIGLFVKLLNNFPGPLVKWVGETMGYDKFAELFNGQLAIWKVCVVYTDGLTKIFRESETEGIIVSPSRGKSWGFEHIFMPLLPRQPNQSVYGCGKTVAELSEAGLKHEYSPRFRALEALKASIDAHGALKSSLAGSVFGPHSLKQSS